MGVNFKRYFFPNKTPMNYILQVLLFLWNLNLQNDLEENWEKHFAIRRKKALFPRFLQSSSHKSWFLAKQIAILLEDSFSWILKTFKIALNITTTTVKVSKSFTNLLEFINSRINQTKRTQRNVYFHHSAPDWTQLGHQNAICPNIQQKLT